MMRLIAVLGFSAVAFGQIPSVVNTGPRMVPPRNAYPFGNILFPGGTGTTGSHATNLGNSVSGIFTGPRSGQFGHGPGGPAGRQRTIVVPYAFPVYTDPGYYAQQQAPNVTVVVPPPTTPTVIINQGYAPETANPAMRVYGDEEQPIDPNASVQIYRAPVAPRPEGKPMGAEAAGAFRSRVIDEKPTIYLIALRDSSVHSAIGYWSSKGDLMFVSPSGQISRVPLDQLDRKTTEQLNTERHVEIDLTTLQ